jgi:acetylornithine deacetylase
MHIQALASVVALVSTFCSARQFVEQRPLNAIDRSVSANKLSLTHDLISFHKGLVEIESISGNEQAVGEWLAASLQSQGYTVQKQYLSKDPVRFNVLAWPGSQRDVKVLLSSHIDTVSQSIGCDSSIGH